MNATAVATLSPERGEKLRRFVANWIQETSVVGVDAVEIIGDDVIARDRFGSYGVGTIADWLPVARALGALRGSVE
ncbi:MAG: hypothetical protein LT106_16725 [Burkholderiaceae bacterium]|nr:hypothetical protein [Burkholderiaceae bacterium]